MPDSVKRLGAQIASADAVLFSSAEYNYSISGALKNCIDWLSRVSPNPFDKKAVGIISSTGGPSGGARSQYDLRKVIVFLNGITMNKPEFFLGSNYLKFDDDF